MIEGESVIVVEAWKRKLSHAIRLSRYTVNLTLVLQLLNDYAGALIATWQAFALQNLCIEMRRAVVISEHSPTFYEPQRRLAGAQNIGNAPGKHEQSACERCPRR